MAIRINESLGLWNKHVLVTWWRENKTLSFFPAEKAVDASVRRKPARRERWCVAVSERRERARARRVKRKKRRDKQQ